MTIVSGGTDIEPYDGKVLDAVEVPDVEVVERPKTVATVYSARDDGRHPIVPAWLRDRDEARADCYAVVNHIEAVRPRSGSGTPSR